MKRRKFILAVTSSLACLQFPLHAKGNSNVIQYTLEEEFKALFSDPENAREIGLIYLKANPDHAQLDYLHQQIGINNTLEPVQSFEQKRQQDFLIGNTVMMDGWVLAKSEVCVCALLAMSAV